MQIINNGYISAFATWYEYDTIMNPEKTVRYISEKEVKQNDTIEFKIVNNSVEIFMIPQYDSLIIRYDQRWLSLHKENEHNWKTILNTVIENREQLNILIESMLRIMSNPKSFKILPEILSSILTIFYIL